MVAHAGLSPREYSSGTSVRTRNHISRIGKSSLRKILYMPVLNCAHKNACNYFSIFYQRLINNGKPKKVALVATMRKVLLTAVGVLKHQKEFDPNWAEKARNKYETKSKTKAA